MRLLFLEWDIDKALRRMALEEEKNLIETVNDILWKGLKDYLKQTGTNHVLHRKGAVSGFTPLFDKDGKLDHISEACANIIELYEKYIEKQMYLKNH